MGIRFRFAVLPDRSGKYLAEMGNRFHQHLVEGRRAEALKIVKEQDIPYADVNIGTKRYWSCVKALQEMVGLSGGPMRPPLMDCTPEQRDELRRVCIEGRFDVAATAKALTGGITEFSAKQEHGSF